MKAVLFAALVSCKSSEAPAPPPTPTGSIDELFGTAKTSPFQLDKLREFLAKATPAERPLIEKLVAYAGYVDAHPKSYDENNRRYVAMALDLLPTLGKNFKTATMFVDGAYQTWSSTRYHGNFDLDDSVARIHKLYAAMFPDEPIAHAALARLISESHLDEPAGLAAAKHCLEHVAKVDDAKFRAEVARQCRQFHETIAADFTAPHCTAVRGDLAFYRGGPKKSEFDPTVAVVIDGETFYRQTKQLTDSSHISAAMQKDALELQLDDATAAKAEELRGGVRGEDDWIIVEADGKPLLAGGWDLDFGWLGVTGAKLEFVCKTPIEKRTVPAELVLAHE